MPSSKSRSSDADNGKKRLNKEKSPSPKSAHERYSASEEKNDSSSQRSSSPVVERRKRHKRTTRKRSLSYSPRRDEKESHDKEDENGACRCLGVFGLSSYTEERDLKEVFSAYGDIEKLCLIYDKQSGHSKGFGFIYFESLEHAISARKGTQGLVLDGRHIRVDYSLTLEPHPSTPGRYQGRRCNPQHRSSNLRSRNDYYSSRPSYRDRSFYGDSYERKRYDRDDYEDFYDRPSRKYAAYSRRH